MNWSVELASSANSLSHLALLPPMLYLRYITKQLLKRALSPAWVKECERGVHNETSHLSANFVCDECLKASEPEQISRNLISVVVTSIESSEMNYIVDEFE